MLAVRTSHGVDFCRAVFAAEFAEGRNIADPTTLRELLIEVGLPPDLADLADDPSNKRALRETVEAARAHHIFGAPSFLVGNELFWGDDRLEDAIAFARG